MTLSRNSQRREKLPEVGVAASDKDFNEFDVLISACGQRSDMFILQVPYHFDGQQFIAKFVRLQQSYQLRQIRVQPKSFFFR